MHAAEINRKEGLPELATLRRELPPYCRVFITLQRFSAESFRRKGVLRHNESDAARADAGLEKVLTKTLRACSTTQIPLIHASPQICPPAVEPRPGMFTRAQTLTFNLGVYAVATDRQVSVLPATWQTRC